jgi:tetratricopeptide (TPR) repeat protein
MIISTTLTGNHEAIIGDALRSVVDWVDVCLVIDTGSTDGSLAIAREIAGEKYRERKHPWGNASDARNFALDAAHELGGTWAMTLDTDERLHLASSADELRSELARDGDVFYASDSQATYTKERFFLLPQMARWQGPAHEAFCCSGVGRKTLSGVTFRELTKTPEEYSARFRRDIDVLSKHIARVPNDPRWHYYLGESHRNLGEYALAVAAYDACAALRGWDEESAWACFHAAECLCALGRHEDALDRLVTGLARHAGIAELAWYAGFVCYQLGRDAQAVHWSRMAIVHGLFRGDGGSIPRIGFRDPVGLYEGPLDVLRWAEKRRGNEAAATEAERLWVEAKAAREGVSR